jgi:hypothetical protein
VEVALVRALGAVALTMASEMDLEEVDLVEADFLPSNLVVVFQEVLAPLPSKVKLLWKMDKK